MEKSDFYFTIEEDFVFRSALDRECKLPGNTLIYVWDSRYLFCTAKVRQEWEPQYVLAWRHCQKSLEKRSIKYKIISFVDIWELKRENKWLTNQS